MEISGTGTADYSNNSAYSETFSNSPYTVPDSPTPLLPSNYEADTQNNYSSLNSETLTSQSEIDASGSTDEGWFSWEAIRNYSSSVFSPSEGSTDGNPNDIQALQAASSPAVQNSADTLANEGLFNAETANDIKNILGAVAVLSNPNTSTAQRISAIAQAGLSLGTTSFTGTVNKPTSIGGISVADTIQNNDGSMSHRLANGELVAGSDLQLANNLQAAVNAVAVLSSGAETEDKVIALGRLGIQVAEANKLINSVQGNAISAGIDLYSTIDNWGELNDMQRINAALNSTNAILTSAQQVTGYNLGTAVGSTASAAAAVAGIVMGVDQASDVIDAVDDMPQSQAVKQGTVGLATSGAAIGAGVAALGVTTGVIAGSTAGTAVVPIIGTVIGAVIGAAIGVIAGSTGTGKNSGQNLRDSWRGVMENMGVANKVDGSHHVNLADGSTYNIGVDGGNRLENFDGSERYTYDIDWSNELATQAIPSAHLFAFATGLDSVDTNQFSLFDRAVAQSANAMTSNATSLEEVHANFRAMLAPTELDPRVLAMRVETMRVSNKITDQEYAVYINEINNIYDTQLVPTERQKAESSLLARLVEQAELSPAEEALFRVLSDPKERQESIERLEQRISSEQENLNS